MDKISLYVLLILFVASIIRSAFGFGESLIAVPLLALLIPVNVAVPLSVLVSITIAAIVTFLEWKEIHYDSARKLIFATLFGIPIGLFILKYGNEKTTKIIIGIVIIIFSLYSIFGKEKKEQKIRHRGWTYVSGFIAGTLGGAYGMNGPPLVLYGSLRGWNPQRFRATLHAYFLPASIIGMIGYWRIGLWTKTVTNYYFLSLIVVLPAIFIGKHVNNVLPAKIFKKSIYISLIGIGVLLMFG